MHSKSVHPLRYKSILSLNQIIHCNCLFIDITSKHHYNLVEMLAKAFDLCAQPTKCDETSFKTTFGNKMCKKQYFHDFPIQMYGAIGQNTLPCMYPGMLLKVFGL